MSRFSAVFSFALILLAPATCRYLSVSDVRGKGAPIPSKIILPFPNKGPIPSAFDWRNVSGKRYTTGAFDQMKPSLCGSCWAHAASGALSDRYKIATGGLAGEINISPQGLLDCSADANDNATYAGSCNGGNPTLAYDSISKLGGISDRTCLPYTGQDFSNWAEIPCQNRLCRACDRFGTCRFLPANETLRFNVEQFGEVNGIDNIKAEIFTRGPVACHLWAHSSSFEDYTGGIIDDTTHYGNGDTTHVIVIVGWGIQNGIEYWIGRNSFGTNWGEFGYFVDNGI